MITVFHYTDQAACDNTSLSWNPDAHTVARLFCQPGNYEVMARLDTDDLERAFALMQNGVHTDSWCLDPTPEIHPVASPIVTNTGRKYGHRSTSVGDILRAPHGDYVVLGRGFQEILEPQ